MHASPVLALLALGTLLTTMKAADNWTYPAARRSDQVDDYFGTKVADPYRWLEDLDSPETKAWVAAENKLTFDYLKSLPERGPIKERMTVLWNYPKFGLPFKDGGHYFFSKNDGLQNQAVLYVQPSLAGTPRMLLDPNTLSADGTVALTATAASHDGQWLAYATAAAGSDWNEMRVRSVATGQDTADLIQWVKFSSLSWTHDSKGFFYSRYPAEKVAEGTGKTFGELKKQRLYYHRLGTEQSADVMVNDVPADDSWFVAGDVTEDGRYLVVSIARGSSNENLLHILDLGDADRPAIGGAPTRIVDTWDAEFSVVGNAGSILYVNTDLDAPHRKVIAIDLASPGREHWKTIIPESPDTISTADLIGGKLVIETMHDVASVVSLYSLDGTSLGRVDLPGIGSILGISGREDSPELFYSFTSFTRPTTIYRRDLATGESSVFRTPKVDFDPSNYVTEQIFYPSKDGTKVPMFITHRKDLKLDGTHPTLLYAYGGFDVSITPAFSVSNLTWLEMGGVYAVPNIRGGGEYGKAWHEAGTKERKQNVFDDFIAAGDWLCAHGYTSHAKLVISGGSNGGLLIGAVLNQRPDLARVAFPAVGVMDMLRFHRFTIGYAWVSDYGSSAEAAGFKYLSAYSPVHNVKTGAHYPAVLVTTADHDDRVYPAHSFKFTAAVQAAVAGVPDAGPILIRIETNAGHGAGKPTTKIIEEASDKLAFAAHFLGMKP
jgi:prolyl oligopeptidase